MIPGKAIGFDEWTSGGLLLTETTNTAAAEILAVYFELAAPAQVYFGWNVLCQHDSSGTAASVSADPQIDGAGWNWTSPEFGYSTTAWRYAMLSRFTVRHLYAGGHSFTLRVWAPPGGIWALNEAGIIVAEL